MGKIQQTQLDKTENVSRMYTLYSILWERILWNKISYA